MKIDGSNPRAYAFCQFTVYNSDFTTSTIGDFTTSIIGDFITSDTTTDHFTIGSLLVTSYIIRHTMQLWTSPRFMHH